MAIFLKNTKKAKNTIATTLCAVILAPFSASSVDDAILQSCDTCTYSDLAQLLPVDSLPWNDYLPWLNKSWVEGGKEVTLQEEFLPEESPQDGYLNEEKIFAVIAQNDTKSDNIITSSDDTSSDNLFSNEIADNSLDDLRGASNFGLSQLDAFASNNQTNNSVTGTNVISDSALSGSSGVTSLIQNSGNNVIIQSSTIVNLTLQ